MQRRGDSVERDEREFEQRLARQGDGQLGDWLMSGAPELRMILA